MPFQVVFRGYSQEYPSPRRWYHRRRPTQTSVVVQMEPHCRTILLESTDCCPYFVSLPYVVFCVMHDPGFHFHALYVYFLSKPLVGVEQTLGLSGLPNVQGQGKVCLGGMTPGGGTEDGIVHSTIDAFFTSRFFCGWDMCAEKFRHWESETRKNPGFGLLLDWESTTRERYGDLTLGKLFNAHPWGHGRFVGDSPSRWR